MPRFQIRNRVSGLTMYDGRDAREALLSFLADRLTAKVRPTVEAVSDDHARVEHDGQFYEAVSRSDLATGPTG